MASFRSRLQDYRISAIVPFSLTVISSPVICWFNSHFRLFILGPRFFTYLISTPNYTLVLLKRHVITIKFLLLFWGWSLLSKLALTLEKGSFCSQTLNRRLDEPLWTMSPNLPFQVPVSLPIKPFGHLDLSTYPFSIHHSCFVFTCVSFIQQEFVDSYSIQEAPLHIIWE